MNNRDLVRGALALAALKLWLVGGLEIYSSPWDPREYLKIAESWYWGDPRNFYRPPGYPLFIALVHATGQPLRVTIEILYLFSAFRCSLAICRLGYPLSFAVAAFVVIVFHPSSFVILSEAVPESLISCLTLLMASEATHALIAHGRARWAYSVATGLVASIAWYTRPETILVMCGLVTLALVAFAPLMTRPEQLRSVVFKAVPVVSPPVLILAISTTAVSLLNGTCFGRYSPKEDLREPHFVEAYTVLQSIDAGPAIRYVPVSSEQRRVAASISPAFAEIEPYFRSSNALHFFNVSRQFANISGEIAGGWWIWALRNAVGYAGYHTVQQKDEFYARLTSEIRDAAAHNRVRLRPALFPLVDPKYEAWALHFPEALAHVISMTVPLRKIYLQDERIANPEIQGLFDRMANRRPTVIFNKLASRQFVENLVPQLGTIYSWLVPTALAVGMMAFILRGRRRVTQEIAMLILVPAIMAGGRIGIFALIHASSYPLIDQMHYTFPATAVLPLFAVSLLGTAFLSETPARSIC